jgi:hypothetical protein
MISRATKIGWAIYAASAICVSGGAAVHLGSWGAFAVLLGMFGLIASVFIGMNIALKGWSL